MIGLADERTLILMTSLYKDDGFCDDDGFCGDDGSICHKQQAAIHEYLPSSLVRAKGYI